MCVGVCVFKKRWEVVRDRMRERLSDQTVEGHLQWSPNLFVSASSCISELTDVELSTTENRLHCQFYYPTYTIPPLTSPHIAHVGMQSYNLKLQTISHKVISSFSLFGKPWDLTLSSFISWYLHLEVLNNLEHDTFCLDLPSFKAIKNIRTRVWSVILVAQVCPTL